MFQLTACVFFNVILLFACSFKSYAQSSAQKPVLSVLASELRQHLVEVKGRLPDGSVHQGVLKGRYEVTMARGNKIYLTDSELWFHQNGQISMVVSPGQFTWSTASGRVLNFNCGMYIDPKSRRLGHRLAKFYDNGEYYSGCPLTEEVSWTTNSASLQLLSGSKVDLTKAGELQYAMQVSGESWLQLRAEKKLYLAHNSEVAFHPNGNPRFFTLMESQSFEQRVAGYGSIEFGRQDVRIATMMDPWGGVISGTPVEPAQVKHLGQTYTLYPRGVVLYQTGQLAMLVFDPWSVYWQSYHSIKADQLKIPLALQDYILGLELAADRPGRQMLCLGLDQKLLSPEQCSEIKL